MMTETEPQTWLLALAMPLAASGLVLLWATSLRRRGRFNGGTGRLHGLGRYFESPRAREIALDLAALGSSTIVTLFTMLFALAFWHFGDLQAGLLLGCASLTAACMGTLLKGRTRRIRPGLDATVSFGSSFPSSHTLMGSTLYGVTAVLLPAHSLALIAALLLALLIGSSRVVLRVHYVSDVVAGWFLAGSLICSVVLLRGVL